MTTAHLIMHGGGPLFMNQTLYYINNAILGDLEEFAYIAKYPEVVTCKINPSAIDVVSTYC